jgi:hypothetical protein
MRTLPLLPPPLLTCLCVVCQGVHHQHHERVVCRGGWAATHCFCCVSFAAAGREQALSRSCFRSVGHLTPLCLQCVHPGTTLREHTHLSHNSPPCGVSVCCLLQAANHTCGEYDRGVDEFQVSGLTPVPSQRVKPPRVRESAVQLECRLNRVIDFKDRSDQPGKGGKRGERGQEFLFGLNLKGVLECGWRLCFCCFVSGTPRV